jgi:hypothetical protein
VKQAHFYAMLLLVYGFLSLFQKRRNMKTLASGRDEKKKPISSMLEEAVDIHNKITKFWVIKVNSGFSHALTMTFLFFSFSSNIR